MPRACRVRQCLGGAATHLISTVVSVGGSDVEDLGRHSWSEAVRGLVACWADILRNQSAAQKRDGLHLEQAQLGHYRERALEAATYIAFCWISASA